MGGDLIARLPSIVECPFCRDRTRISRFSKRKVVLCTNCNRKFHLWEGRLFSLQNKKLVEMTDKFEPLIRKEINRKKNEITNLKERQKILNTPKTFETTKIMEILTRKPTKNNEILTRNYTTFRIVLPKKIVESEGWEKGEKLMFIPTEELFEKKPGDVIIRKLTD